LAGRRGRIAPVMSEPAQIGPARPAFPTRRTRYLLPQRRGDGPSPLPSQTFVLDQQLGPFAPCHTKPAQSAASPIGNRQSPIGNAYQFRFQLSDQIRPNPSKKIKTMPQSLCHSQPAQGQPPPKYASPIGNRQSAISNQQSNQSPMEFSFRTPHSELHT
jgi:hypothetical protein